MLQCVKYPVIINGRGDIISNLLQGIIGIPHSHSYAGFFYNRNIIPAVPERHRLGQVESPPMGYFIQPFGFANTICCDVRKIRTPSARYNVMAIAHLPLVQL